MKELISICINEIKKLKRQVFLMLGPARSTTAVNDSGPIRTVQVTLGYNQIKDAVPVMQQYGFASNFPPASDLILGFVAGDRSNGCIIGSNNQQYVIKNLGAGAVGVYDMFGNTIVLSEGGIQLNSPKSYAWDVDGYGQRVTSNGSGAYTIDSYTEGATVTSNSHAINPPKIP